MNEEKLSESRINELKEYERKYKKSIERSVEYGRRYRCRMRLLEFRVEEYNKNVKDDEKIMISDEEIEREMRMSEIRRK